MKGLGRRSVQLFPFAILIVGLHAWFSPSAYAPHSAKIPWLLGIVMFGMGMTLSIDDFIPLVRTPKLILLAMAAQFTVMPLGAVVIARWLKLPGELAAGLILVGCCPGGTASNVITYLARGDVAYSVAMTSCSTLLAPVLTPLLTWWLCGTLIKVPVVSLFVSTAEIILIPVALGILFQYAAVRWLTRLVEVLPAISALMITLIIAVIVAEQKENLRAVAVLAAGAVILHNGAGLLLGYAIGAAFGLSKGRRRALSIEVGMQNSGLAVALATVYLGGMSAVPGAMFSVWHNLSGSILAGVWVRMRD